MLEERIDCREFADAKSLPRAFGWQPDIPDVRDYTFRHPVVATVLAELEPPDEELPDKFRWRESLDDLPESDPDFEYWALWPQALSQGSLKTASVHGVLTLVQHLAKRAKSEIRPPSRLFTYRAIRQAARLPGDSGSGLRDVFKAVFRQGLPPEELWPYDSRQLDAVPDPELFAYRDACQGGVYVRLDPPSVAGEQLLHAVKFALFAGFPAVFGLSIYPSCDGRFFVQLPDASELLLGGQAAVVVGYRDLKRSKGGARGHLLIRLPWGESFGIGGLVALPYEYVLQGLARDFWTLLHPGWIQRDGFLNPVPSARPAKTLPLRGR